ncbi:MAG TPA: metallophosphoesterase family protein [Bryobacteraceae bacterium]
MNRKKAAVVGMISDTHGLLRPEAIEALAGSDLIIHAGDVGKPEVLNGLEAVAPVVAVRGNIDTEPWASKLPLTAPIRAGSAAIYVIHDVHALGIDPAAEGFQIVVSGHSHKPAQSERNGVLYLNPGAAGPRRFRLPVTLARLHVRRPPWKVEWIDLTGGKIR